MTKPIEQDSDIEQYWNIIDRLVALEQNAIQSRPILRNKRGANNVQSAGFTTTVSATDGAASPQPIQISITPQTPGRLQVAFQSNMKVFDWAWYRCDIAIDLGQTDLDGVQYATQAVMHHGQTTDWTSGRVFETYHVDAGITYTPYGYFSPTGSTWYYFHGASYLKLSALFIPE